MNYYGFVLNSVHFICEGLNFDGTNSADALEVVVN